MAMGPCLGPICNFSSILSAALDFRTACLDAAESLRLFGGDSATSGEEEIVVGEASGGRLRWVWWLSDCGDCASIDPYGIEELETLVRVGDDDTSGVFASAGPSGRSIGQRCTRRRKPLC